ncbi:MAG: dTDP-4-dehydrorhamnose reductase [Firmicutes bacterium]|nr:dTDP-4-dehydrorhamnose reductase [Bacillota bacterium]
MRALITGASGMLGRDMAKEFCRRGFEVVTLDRGGLDITDLACVNRAFKEHGPHLAVNCAGFTKVDRAESQRREAFLVNGLGPRNLALACGETGAALVQISTDYVFDGRLDRPYEVYDVPGPVNVYGASKLWGERAVLGLLRASYIIRTGWLFGLGGENFVSAMISLGREGKPVQVVDDQFGCPTFTEDLARAVSDLAQTGCYGIYHITNQNATTWFKFAGAIFDRSKLVVDLIPCRTRDTGRAASRPGFSVLDPFPLQETIGYLLPRWEDALWRYLSKKGELQA